MEAGLSAALFQIKEAFMYSIRTCLQVAPTEHIAHINTFCYRQVALTGHNLLCFK